MSLRKKLTGFVAASAAIVLALTGCAGNKTNDNGSASSTTAASQSQGENLGKITVFAAASLTDALQELSDEVFVKQHPGTEVVFNFDGSQNLVDGIHQGQPADILLTADQKNMTKATNNGDVEADQSYATNTLVLVTPTDNPGNVTEFSTQNLDGKRLVICAPAVPCGNATKKLAENLNVTLNPVSEEQNVKDVQTKVTSGEADAGLIYKTDAMSAKDKVKVIEIDGADQVVNDYRVAVVKKAENKAGAEAFLKAVLSDEGQAVLAKYGFSAPTK